MILDIPDISHGHGLSFKKGIVDGILGENRFENDLPDGGHSSSYKKGYDLGESLKSEIATKVKPNNIGE